MNVVPSITNTCDVCGVLVVGAESRPYVLTAIARHGFECYFCFSCCMELQRHEGSIARILTRATMRAAGKDGPA